MYAGLESLTIKGCVRGMAIQPFEGEYHETTSKPSPAGRTTRVERVNAHVSTIVYELTNAFDEDQAG